MPGLPLDAPRTDALRRAADHIAEAWASFDHARDGQPLLDDALARVLAGGLPEQPTPVLTALDDAAQVLDESLAPARPRYFAFVGSSGLEVGVLADALASCYDVNLATHAGVADLVERQALDWVARFIGFPASGGAFTSGGMISNLTALAAARENALPAIRETGSRRPAGRPLLLGRGPLQRPARGGGARPRRRQRAVDPDRRPAADARRGGGGRGRPRPRRRDHAGGGGRHCRHDADRRGRPDRRARRRLRRARRVAARRRRVRRCRPPRAPATRSLFAGLERADSVVVDAHKWLYLPKACGVVLVRERAALERAFVHDEAYMLHGDDGLNAVDRTLEYSRPFRALKLWLAFRVHGAAAFREAIADNVALARRLADTVRAHDELELVVPEPQLSTVPFRHAPPGVADLDAHNLALVEALQHDSRVYVSSAEIDGHVCLRPCIVNFRTTAADVDALVEVTLELGRELAGATRTS